MAVEEQNFENSAGCSYFMLCTFKRILLQHRPEKFVNPKV
jgi:hypothetical protein